MNNIKEVLTVLGLSVGSMIVYLIVTSFIAILITGEHGDKAEACSWAWLIGGFLFVFMAFMCGKAYGLI